MVGSVLLPEPLLPPPEPLLPLPEPGLLPIPEPPHPMMNKTWSATANEQREERKSLSMRTPDTRMDAAYAAFSA